MPADFDLADISVSPSPAADDAVAFGADDISALARQGLPAPSLTVDAAAPVGKVSPTLYGLMTEEINYAYDGGLYGELLRDRNFAASSRATDWRVSVGPGGDGAVGFDTSAPLNPASPTSLRLTATAASASARVGIVNTGYWGIPIKPDTRYRASFYARAVSPDFIAVFIAVVRSSRMLMLLSSGIAARRKFLPTPAIVR